MTDDVYARETVSIQMMMMIYTTAKSKCPERNDYSKYRDATLSGNASAGWVQCSKRRKKTDCGKIFEILPRDKVVFLCPMLAFWGVATCASLRDISPLHTAAMAASRGRPFASGGESGGPDTEDAGGQVTVGQIASLKQSVSELRRDIIGAPTTDDKHREHSLEDENLNLKIRMRQLEEVVAGLSEQATGEAAEPDDVSTNVSALRSELSSLALGMDQKQGELLQVIGSKASCLP